MNKYSSGHLCEQSDTEWAGPGEIPDVWLDESNEIALQRKMIRNSISCDLSTLPLEAPHNVELQESVYILFLWNLNAESEEEPPCSGVTGV